MITVVTNPYTINNLTAGTAYDFYVRANCGVGDESDWTGPITAIPGAFIMPTLGEHSVTMCGGTIYDDGGPDGNYSTNCDVALVVNPDSAGLKVHLTGTFNVEADYDWLVIIDGDDLDGNVLFDSDEDATLDVVSTTGPLTIYFSSDGSVTYSGFEIHVDCVGDTVTNTCSAPTNLTYSEVTNNSVKVDWVQEGTPDNWTVSYRKTASATWSTTTVTAHPYTITNLDADTEYEVYVTATCDNETSGESNHITFTTALVSVNDYEMGNTVVYPNPTTGMFTIQNSQSKIQRVEMYDVFGKLMNSMEVDDNSTTVDISSFAAGVYFTRVISEKGTTTIRVVKN